MNDFESYYECKRCLFQTHQKNDMKRHLNKINKCTRNFESFKYKDEELNVLSLQIIYNKAKEYLCIGCNKKYSNKSNLERHVKEYCKNTNNIKDLINTFHKNLHNSTDNNNSDNSNGNNNNNSNVQSNDNINITNENNIINVQNDLININNLTINNIDNVFMNININSLKDFKEDWDVSKINNAEKLHLLTSTFKFTNTLKNILENEVNLNVLIDNTTDSGFVYTNNSLEKMDLKDICKQSMEKIYNHLIQFEKDLISQVDEKKYDINDIGLNHLKEQLKEAKDKWTDYRRQKNINANVNNALKNIYNGNKIKTIKTLDKVIDIPKAITNNLDEY